MNYKTRTLTDSEFYSIINTIKEGFTTTDNKNIKPNLRIATACILQANLGLRIGDIVNLRLSDIVRDGNRYRLSIHEQKTTKLREFTVPAEIFTFIQGYALEQGIKSSQRLFGFTVRAVQKHLKVVTDFLGLKGVSTHSFRKYFAVSIYNNNNYNVELVRELLQHSTVAVTQHYLSVSSQLVEQALAKHIKLPS